MKLAPRLFHTRVGHVQEIKFSCSTSVVSALCRRWVDGSGLHVPLVTLRQPLIVTECLSEYINHKMVRRFIQLCLSKAVPDMVRLCFGDFEGSSDSPPRKDRNDRYWSDVDIDSIAKEKAEKTA